MEKTRAKTLLPGLGLNNPLPTFTQQERDAFNPREVAVWGAVYAENWCKNFREIVAEGNSVDTALRGWAYGYLSCVIADSAVNNLRYEEEKTTNVK
jgi:hypothetical protein